MGAMTRPFTSLHPRKAQSTAMTRDGETEQGPTRPLWTQPMAAPQTFELGLTLTLHTPRRPSGWWAVLATGAERSNGLLPLAHQHAGGLKGANTLHPATGNVRTKQDKK
jgi:hypothetical protein